MTMSSQSASYTALGRGENAERQYSSAYVSRKSMRASVVDGKPPSCVGLGVDNNSLEGFSQYIYGVSPSFWFSMVMGGFVAPGGGPTTTKVWQFIFMFSMLFCGTTCMINVFIKDPPFHNTASDAMVSLIHVPGFYSIFLWRKILGDPTSSVWFILSHGEKTQKELKDMLSVIGPFFIPAQVAVVCLVWAGYSIPTQLYVQDHMDSAGILTKVHNYSMWIVIPPVVACVVANAAFFAFFVYAMYLQINALLMKMFLREEVDLEGTNGRPRGLTEEDHVQSKAISTKNRTMTENTKAMNEMDDALEQQDFEAFMAVLADDIFRMQDMLDMVCESWSSLVALFLTFAFWNIMAVFYDFIVIYTGTATFKMTIYVYCIDAFLGISGLLIVMGFLIMGAILTQRMDDLCVESVEVMRAAHVPISKAASTFYYLQTGGRTTLLGFKVYGYRIEWSHAVGFISLLLTALGFVMSGGSPQQAPAATA